MTADGPSRLPDYEIGYTRTVARLLATTSVQPYDDLRRAIIAAQASDALAVDISAKLVDRPAAVDTDTAGQQSQWIVVVGALTYEGWVYIPAADSLHRQVRSLFHDNLESGHFGAFKTTELVSRDFYWPAMDLHIWKYVSGCEVCPWINAPRYARHGINLPLQSPSWPWEGVTMDYDTNLPDSIALGYTMILVIVDWLSKMAIYSLCGNDIDTPELARLFFEHVICKHGVLDNIVTDRGTQFTSRFWRWVCSHLSTDHGLSTSIHPQTDEQTQRQSETMEQHLPVVCIYEQEDWVELLPLAKLAYNNTVHPSMRMTPFWGNDNYHPVMQFKPWK